MTNKTDIYTERARQWVWSEKSQESSWLARFLMFLVRLTVALARDISQGELTLRAMSLVYTTLMSFVPLLAVSFSVLKGLGAHNFLEDFLYEFLAPLGEKGIEITDNILRFIENIKVGLLGAVGIAFLLYTVVALIQKIESTFNFIWRINKLRSIGQRFSDYLSVVFVGPILIFLAMGTTASINNNVIVQSISSVEPFGSLFVIVGKLLPFLFVIIAFTFVYSFLPNTHVKLKSALVGGLVAGTLWQALSLFFATFIASFTNFSAIYSGFAVIIVLLLWLYLGWLTLLLGCSVAYYHQTPSMMRFSREALFLSARQREKIGLSAMLIIAERFAKDAKPISETELATQLSIPESIASEIIKNLLSGYLIKATLDNPTTFVPARDIARISIFDVLNVLRNVGSEQPVAQGVQTTPSVNKILMEMEQSVVDQWSQHRLSDYVD